MSSSNFNCDVSIIRQSLHCIEKDFDKKVQKSKNFLQQTTFSLQKISDSKIELIQSSTSNIKSIDSKRKISISNMKESQKEGELKSINEQNEVKKTSELNINQNISQNLIPLNMQASLQVQSINIAGSLIQDNDSSKCSIQIDLKSQECSKQSENPLFDQQEIYIDGNNQLEKRIHQWLDSEGVKMVNPCKKYQDYFDQKRSQILIMYKKKNSSMHTSTSHSIHNSENHQPSQIYHEKHMSCSQSASPQKYFNGSKIESQQKLINLRTPQKNNHNGPEIIVNSLFSTSITDSPLMQRRRVMLQSTQVRDPPQQFTFEKKKVEFLQLNPANSGVKSSLAHLSQYKRTNQQKSNSEITPADIQTDCK